MSDHNLQDQHDILAAEVERLGRRIILIENVVNRHTERLRKLDNLEAKVFARDLERELALRVG